MDAFPQSVFAPAGVRPAGGPPRIVVVGGGAGGLELAARLGDGPGRRGEAEVVLVDPQPAHLWKPLLHELAAGTLTIDEGAIDYLQQARRHRFRFHLGAMSGLDRRRREVLLAPLVDDDGSEIAPARALGYDFLVVSIGSRDNDFAIPGVRAHAVPLNATSDAAAFHRRLLALIARAEMVGLGPVGVVIVGGGATGVELAAELAEATQEIASYGAHLRRHGRAVRLTVVEGAPRLLAALPEAVACQAGDDLRRQGVEVLLGQRVTGVAADSVTVSDGRQTRTLASDLTVWAAGIRCTDLLADLDGLESNRLNQLVVTPTLQTTRDARVFALGDCASCAPQPGRPPVPPMAQAAHQQARHLARSLAGHLRGRPLPAFAFHDRGSLVSLGHHDAVGNLRAPRLKTVVIHGLLARFSYWLLYRRHLATLLGFRRTLLAVVGSWLAGGARPRVKLH